MRFTFFLPKLNRLLLGGGVFCALALGGVLWLDLDLPAGDPDDRAAARTASSALPGEKDVEPANGTDIGSWDRQAIVTSLLRQPADRSVVPFRIGYEPPSDSGFSYHGVRYDDPTGGEVPLEWVAAEADRLITPSFRLRDFMTRDGAPLARISPMLVEGLERMRQRGADVQILSGYRHPSYNMEVGGAGDSQHQAGKAADIWATNRSPLELAELALEQMGCDIGLGLGATSLHVDVRGELTTWTYRGAALRGPAFAAWVRTHCGLPISAALARRAEAAWLEESDDDSVEETHRSEPTDPGGDLLALHEETIMATASGMYPLRGPGAVVLDLRTATGSDAPRYLQAGDAGLVALGIDRLVSFCGTRRETGCFAFVILSDDEPPLTGVMSLGSVPRQRTPRPAAPASPTATEPGQAAPQRAAAEQWGIVVASVTDAAAARDVLQRERSRLRQHGHSLRLVTADGRYRVVVGDFDSQEVAVAVLASLRGDLPPDAWLLEM